MKDLHIIAATRTPFCRMGTSLASLDAVELGRVAVSGLLTQSGIDSTLVDETILGCVGQPAEAQNIARVIALRAGIPESKPAMTVHRNCASGLESILTAHQRLNAGMGEVFIVGGVESMSNMPLHFPRSAVMKFAELSKARNISGQLGVLTALRPTDFMPLIALRMGLTDPVSALSMGETAEVLAREFEISREAQDAFAMRSHHRATKASWALQKEITPVMLDGKVIATDNGIRSDSSLERLRRLPPLFDQRHGSVTAGNSSQITDGAVALLAASESAVKRNGWNSLGILKAYAVTGCDPARMGLGPVRAIHDVLHRTGTSLCDYDIVEINEAFAAQTLAVVKCLRYSASARRAGLDEPLGAIEDARLNPCGGAISLGHPVGATGARLVLTALRQLHDTDKRRALISLCVGGGQGVAAVLEAS